METECDYFPKSLLSVTTSNKGGEKTTILSQVVFASGVLLKSNPTEKIGLISQKQK